MKHVWILLSHDYVGSNVLAVFDHEPSEAEQALLIEEDRTSYLDHGYDVERHQVRNNIGAAQPPGIQMKPKRLVTR